MDPQETPRQYPALQERAELPLDKCGKFLVKLPPPRQKRFQLFADDLIQHRCFRIARPVPGADSHEGIA